MDDVGFTLSLDYFSMELLLNKREPSFCTIFDSQSLTNMGILLIEKNVSHVEPLFKSSLKRKVANVSVASPAFNDQHQSKVPKKDVGQIFKEMKLVPEMGSDLQCSLCPFLASHKSSLKTHYKLKHLGGADLAMNCSMCEQRFVTKGSLKRHLVNIHKLSSTDAQKILS